MIRKIIQYITHDIWVKKEHEYKSRKMRWAVRQFKVFIFTAQGFGQHGILVRSAALTFYTLMSIVPVAALVFGIAKGFGLETRLNEYLYNQFPQYTVVIDQVIAFANAMLLRTKGGLIASVGLVVLFWAVLKVFGNIESAFNNIWEVRRSRSFARKFSDYTTVIVVTPILWIISSSIGLQIQKHLMHLTSSPVVNVFLGLASLVMIWLMFAFVYLVMPNTKVKLRSAVSAGVIAGTIFQLFQIAYIFIQSRLTSYNAIYGSFAAVPLFLIWLQSSWQIVLFGAELSFAYQNIARFGEERESLLISYDQRRKVLLAVMLTVVRNFRDKGGAMPADEIRARLGLPTRIVNDVLFQLVQAGQLIAVRSGDGERETAFTPAHDIASMTVYGVLEAVERSGQTTFDLGQTPELARVDRELEMLKDSARQSQENVRLTELL